MGRALDATSIESDFEEAAFAMVLNRLYDPMSKLAMIEWMRDVYRPEWEGLELHRFYRALDFLADRTVCFLALVLDTALRRKLGAITKEVVPYNDLLHQLEEVKAVEINLDGKRYLARTELVGHADLAFRALGTRPPLRVTELPRRQNDPGKECCGTRDSYATKPNDDEVSQK